MANRSGLAWPAVLGLVIAGASHARAPSQSLPTSLGMAVFPAQQQATEQAVAQQEKLDLFKRGFGACLESKEYTVK